MMKSNLFRIFTCTLFILLSTYGCDKKEDGKITVVTKPVTDVTVSSAKSGGNVTVTGNFSIGMCGVCWSKSPSPSTNDYFTTDNTGAGEFVSNIKNLEPDTKYFVRAYATTSSGIMYGEEIDFTTESLSVASVTVNTSEVSEITASTAKCGGVVTASGDVMVTARGVYWSTFQNFSQNVSQTSDGQGLGSFTSNLSELSASTMYYVKAYATTADGNIVFGDTKTFTTGGETPVLGLPTVTIGDVTGITSTSANCSGEVTSDGGSTVTERGFCWNISPNPMVYHSHVSSGSGTGSFSAELTGLTEGATYYVRAYATNSVGTTYSEEHVSFTAENGGIGLHSYDFESGMEDWAPIDVDGDGLSWTHSSDPGVYHNTGVNLSGSGHNASSGFVLSGSYANQTQAVLIPDNYLVSPQRIAISSGASITFYVCAQDANYPAEHYGVAVSTAINPSASSFTTIWEETLSAKVRSDGSPRGTRVQGNWYMKTIDLSAYAGQSIWIAFRHFDSSDQFIINIDDITIDAGE